VLYAVIRDHLDGFLREASTRGGGDGLPEFVEREFREFLTCGILAHGFARFRCEGCAFERFVPFSCKGRGFCPSCGGRRMTERAAHLVDEVLPWVPVRQWVLTMPYRLRYLLAWNHRLSRAVLGAYVRAVLEFYRRRAREGGIRDGRTGTLTVIQRFGSGLNLNVHFHTVVLDGVFSQGRSGALEFHPAPAPSDEEVARVLDTARRRVGRFLARCGLEPGDDGAGPADGLADESPTLAGLASASVRGRIALGPRAGRLVRRLGNALDPSAAGSRGPRQAQLEGFDLLFFIGTEAFILSFPPDVPILPEGARTMHLDLNAWEIGKNYPADPALLGDPKATLPLLDAALEEALGEAGRARAGERRREAEQTAAAIRKKLTPPALTPESETSKGMPPAAFQAALGEALPRGCALVDESITTGGPGLRQAVAGKAGGYFGMKGGGIGLGLPTALGVKVALPERPVVCVSGDGSAMYTLQAWWTMAREPG